MIYGTGIDIIEVERIGRLIGRKEKYLRRVFTEVEIAYCNSFKCKAMNFAGRFAAKEAFSKALGTGFSNGIKLNEIEIINDKLGKPEIRLYGGTKAFFEDKRLDKIFVSITHIKNYASACVVIEKIK
ncbi:MAG: holo-ACP synthase [Candidatus Cloacimonetes bacterium]|nr:holo-ACP synthase [Candidatus Cloacimonadota bacterium]